MNLFWIVAGATAGGVALGIPGALCGAGIGYLLAARRARSQRRTAPRRGRD